MQARKHLEKSEVVDNDTGEGKPDSVRTSSGAFFGVAEDPVRLTTPSRRSLNAACPPSNAFAGGKSIQGLGVRARR